MKKLYTIIIIALFLCSTIAGCKKSTNAAPPDSIPQILSETYYYSGGQGEVVLYQYDGNGRNIKQTDSNSGAFDTLVYSNSTVLRKSYSSAGTLQQTDTYILNSKGLAISYTYGSTKQNKACIGRIPYIYHMPGLMSFPQETSYTDTYEYDANGYMVKQTWYSSGDTTIMSFQYTNGNRSSYTYSSSSNSETVKVAYLLNKQNTIGQYNSGIFFLGKQDRNLPGTISVQYYYQGTCYYDTVQCSYQYDNKNRVIKQFNLSGSYSDSTSYTYKN